MRRLRVMIAIASALLAGIAGCSAPGGGPEPGTAGSWIVGTWQGDVIDTAMRIEFTASGDYEWTVAESGESLATGTWSARSDASPVDLVQLTGQQYVFSVLPYAVFDGDRLHITAEEDYLIQAYIDPEAPQGNIEALLADVRQQPNVASLNFTSAEDAAAELEAAAEASETIQSGTDSPGRIEITLDDWSLQSEFIDWLGADPNFEIVRVDSSPIREPSGLEFIRVDQ